MADEVLARVEQVRAPRRSERLRGDRLLASLGASSLEQAWSELASRPYPAWTEPLDPRVVELLEPGERGRVLGEAERALARQLDLLGSGPFDLGRPADDSWMGDVMPPVAEAKFAKKHLKSWVKPHRVSLPISQLPGKAWYDFEPLGVVFIVGPCAGIPVGATQPTWSPDR